MKSLKSVSRLKRFNKSAFCVAVLVISSGLPLAAQTAFVRVNQVGYVGGGSKRAYLMSSGAESGATFSVRNSSGTSVLTAPIGANLGSWSRSYPNVYALDFSNVTASGTYTITVNGPIAASSPSFRIDTAANVYARRWPIRFPTTRTSAMVRTSSPARCAQRLRT